MIRARTIERKIRNFLIKVNDIPCLIQEFYWGKKRENNRNFFFIHVRLIRNSSELLTFLGRNSHYTDELSKQDRKDNLYSLFIIIIGIILSKLLSLY